METGLLLKFLLALSLPVFVQGIFTCYVCSYSLSGDPSLHYECITSPWNFTNAPRTLTCEDNEYCITKTVYTVGYGKIWSGVRRCGQPEKFACGTNCCFESAHNAVCQHHCRGNYCNVEDESTRLKPVVGGPSNTGRNLSCDIIMMLLLLLLLMLINM